MSIVKYKNQSGQIYAYDQTSYWDAEKKQSRSKRKLLGRVDPVTGEIIPTEKRRGRPKKAESVSTDAANDSEDYRALYESVLAQLDDAKGIIDNLTLENGALQEEISRLKDLVQMIHEKTNL